MPDAMQRPSLQWLDIRRRTVGAWSAATASPTGRACPARCLVPHAQPEALRSKTLPRRCCHAGFRRQDFGLSTDVRRSRPDGQQETIGCIGGKPGVAHCRQALPRWRVLQAVQRVGRVLFRRTTPSARHAATSASTAVLPAALLLAGLLLLLPFTQKRLVSSVSPLLQRGRCAGNGRVKASRVRVLAVMVACTRPQPGWHAPGHEAGAGTHSAIELGVRHALGHRRGGDASRPRLVKRCWHASLQLPLELGVAAS